MTPGLTIAAGDVPSLEKEIHGDMPEDRMPLADSFRAAKVDFEKNFIVRKLQEFDGNISRTAEAIGLERSNLHRKIKAYGLETKGES